PRWDDLVGWSRMQDLEQQYRAVWLADLPKVPGVPYYTWFTRGFVDTLTVKDATAFAAHAGELFAAAPIRGLILEELTEETADVIAAVPEMARVRELRIEQHERLPAEALRRLAASPYLAGLKGLDLYELPLPKALLREIQQAPWRLERLYLGGEYAG